MGFSFRRWLLNSGLPVNTLSEEFLVADGSRAALEDDFQFDRRTEWKARGTKD
jgi:hypothetical protein